MANTQGWINLGTDVASGAATGSAAGPWGAVIGGAVGLGEGIYGLIAGSNAEKAQQAAADAAQKRLQDYYQQAAAYEQPYMNVGSQAAGQLGNMLSSGQFNMPEENFQYNYQQDPAYQNQLTTGNQQVMANAGSLGQMFSGATMKALQKYGVNMANANYNENYNRQFNQYNTQYQNNAAQKQNQFMRQYNTANMGQNAAAALSGAQRGLGGELAGIDIQKGNLTAANDIGQAQTIGNMIGSAGRIVGGLFGGNQRMTQPQDLSSANQIAPGEMIPASNNYGLGLTNNSKYNLGGANYYDTGLGGF